MEKWEQMDKPLRDLIEISHFTESVSTKIHGVLDKAEIYKTLSEAFMQSKWYIASILLLTDDGEKLRVSETSVPREQLMAGERVAGIQLREYEIDLKKSSIFNQVIREGKTVQVNVSDIIGESFPRPLADLVSKTMGYEKKPCILTPLQWHGNIIGALAISATDLAEHFIPSVKNLARHISTALELADDYAEHKRTMDQLQQSEERYRSLYESSRDGIVTTNLNGRITECNQAYAEMLGYSREELKRTRYQEITPCKWHALDKDIFREVMERGYSYEFEKEYIRKDDTVFPISLRKWRIDDEAGNPTGLCSIVRDVTERKQTEEALHRGHDELEMRVQERTAELARANETLRTEIVERKRAEEEIRQRTAQLEALRQVELELIAQLDLDALLHSIASRAVELLGGTGGGLDIYRPERDVLEHSMSIGLNPVPSMAVLQRGEGLSGKVLEIGEPLIVDDYQHWEGQATVWEGHPAMAVVGVPVHWGDEFLGVLQVTANLPRTFSPADAELLSLFATQAALAIRNARLHEQAQHRMESLANLNRASRVITSSLDVEKVLEQIVDLAGAVINSDYTSVVLLDEEGQPVRETEHFTGMPTVSQRIRNRGITRLVLGSGQPVVVDDISGEGKMSPPVHWPDGESMKANPAAVTAGICSFAAAPIQTEGRTIGVLFVHSLQPRTFHGQLPLLTTFANQAAIAVRNARLFEAEREQRELAEALEEAAAAVSSTLDPDQVLDRILEQVERVVVGDAFNVMLLENGIARIVRWRGYERVGVEVRGAPFPVARYPSLVKMAQTGEPAVIPDTTVDPDWIPMESQEWLRSYVGAPIRVRDMAVGLLNVAGTRPGQFGPADGRRLEAFAAHAATAIENAQLYRELLDHAEQLGQRVQERTTQLQAQYARLDAILRSTADGIVVADAGGEIIHTNPVAQVWLTQALSPEDAARLRQAVRDLGQRVREQPETVLELTGLDLELKAAPISQPKFTFPPASGRVGGEGEAAAVVNIHDVSHLKALDRIKTRFVSNVSHDLRTPVTTIKLYAALMQRSPPEKWEEYLNALTQEADRQAQLVEDILQISRIDTGQLEIKPWPTSLNALTKEAVANRQALAQDRGLVLEHRPAELGPAALVDPERMMQVLNNLVENAIYYTPAGGEIVVSTSKEEMEGRVWATVTVADTGIGIPEEELPHIFKRFFRGEKPRMTQISGTGLGLAIVKEIVELHGGRVIVESQADAGTTFTIWLPLAK